MIYYPESMGMGDTDEALVRHIAEQISTYCGEEALVDSGRVDEVACAVANYVSDSVGPGAVQSSYLILLTSRALCAVGENRAARRLLMFGTGLVRPSRWEFTGSEAMWVVDLREMAGLADAGLELAFFNGLMAVLDMIAEVWDATNGAGVLGLRHVTSAAIAMFGAGANRRQAGRLAREIRDLCNGKFDAIRDRRQWTHTPVIMDLDLQA